MDLDVDKEVVHSMSVGDYLHIVSGADGHVGGFKSGHFAGTGMATFGYWYLLVLGLLMIPAFFLVDKFTKTRTIPNPSGFGSIPAISFSFCGLLSLTKIFQFLGMESVIAIFTFLMRDWLQLAILYLFIFHITGFLNKALVRRRRLI